MHGGREILVTPAPGVDERTLRAFLLGAVLAVLLHQRGCLILHGSAVAIQGVAGAMAALAFVGHPGQGKSTLAAAMHAGGSRFVADDLIAVPNWDEASPTAPKPAEAHPIIYPGYPQMRLWPQALEALGEDAQGWPLVARHEAKRARSVPQGFQPEPLLLRAAFVLEDGDFIRCELLSRQAAMMTLINHSYCVRALATADTRANFLQCAHSSKTLPVYRLQRPRDLQQLSAVVQLILATINADTAKL